MNRHQLMSAGLLACLLGGHWFLVARGEMAQIRGLETAIRGMHLQQHLSELRAQRLDQDQAEADEALGWLEQIMEAHTVTRAPPDMLLQVEAELQASGLTSRQSRPRGVLEGERLDEQSLEVQVECELKQLLEFLRRVEASRPFCRVTEMRVQPGRADGSVRADLVVTRLWREV